MRKGLFALIVALVALAALTACARKVTVREIIDNPEGYRGKVVELSGKASDSVRLPLLNRGFYRLDDGTGSIVVLTDGEIHRNGETVVARGKVQPTFEIGGRVFGLVLVPEKR